MKIGNKLKGLRVEKGFSTTVMAGMLGVSEPTYRRYETDKSSPDLEMLSAIAKALDKNFLDLMPSGYINANAQNQNFEADSGMSKVYQLSEKLIEQYELRLKEKDDFIAFLKKEQFV